MSTDLGAHWESVYASKSDEDVSWHQLRAETSLRLIEEAAADLPDAAPDRLLRVIDVGGGASRLADGLLERGGVDLCVVDVADSGMARARRRLGTRADKIRWLVADVAEPLSMVEPAWADIWHDRAAMHFLTDDQQRRGYAENVSRILRPGGCAIIGTFAPDGPTSCSGLAVQQHDGASLAHALSSARGADAAYRLAHEEREIHSTPWGAEQMFTWAVLQRQS